MFKVSTYYSHLSSIKLFDEARLLRHYKNILPYLKVLFSNNKYAKFVVHNIVVGITGQILNSKIKVTVDVKSIQSNLNDARETN